MTSSVREGASALLVSSDGRLLMQLRDDLPHVSDAGKISLFGGRREGTETFLECVVREVHEEIGHYLPPERFELIGSYSGPDHLTPNRTLRGEVFLVRDVPVDQLTVTEGRLVIVAVDELEPIGDRLARPAQYALAIFLKRKRIT
ncbi:MULTISPECIES: NUDIX domain-containing protein [Bradyrhizobium]|jgi:8-oxo-dGTP diphosphatase|uniref:NUDIX domain-containing protein n=1 Tax=Bradyrhizobium TaxID=374 RepID=UPI0004632DF9|nr:MULTISPECIES: NUDIX domain-containing protein [Bradyrhizobium]